MTNDKEETESVRLFALTQKNKLIGLYDTMEEAEEHMTLPEGSQEIEYQILFKIDFPKEGNTTLVRRIYAYFSGKKPEHLFNRIEPYSTEALEGIFGVDKES